MLRIHQSASYETERTIQGLMAGARLFLKHDESKALFNSAVEKIKTSEPTEFVDVNMHDFFTMVLSAYLYGISPVNLGGINMTDGFKLAASLIINVNRGEAHASLIEVSESAK